MPAELEKESPTFAPVVEMDLAEQLGDREQVAAQAGAAISSNPNAGSTRRRIERETRSDPVQRQEPGATSG